MEVIYVENEKYEVLTMMNLLTNGHGHVVMWHDL